MSVLTVFQYLNILLWFFLAVTALWKIRDITDSIHAALKERYKPELFELETHLSNIDHNIETHLSNIEDHLSEISAVMRDLKESLERQARVRELS